MSGHSATVAAPATSSIPSSTTTAGKEREEARVKWLPLEADPVLLAQYVNTLGGPVSCAVEGGDDTERRHEAPEALLSFEDVLSLEDWALDRVRNPTVAVLLVYPLPKNDLGPQQSQRKQQQQQHTEEGIWFTMQVGKKKCKTCCAHVQGQETSLYVPVELAAAIPLAIILASAKRRLGVLNSLPVLVPSSFLLQSPSILAALRHPAVLLLVQTSSLHHLRNTRVHFSAAAAAAAAPEP